MRALAGLLGLLMAFALAGVPARADDVPSGVPGADRQAIQGVIAGQMRAFRADDANAAFAAASPGIQSMFGDAGRFLEMVRSAYPMVYRPRETTFGALVEMDGHPVQKVHVVGPDGHPALALYYMEREGDGSWRIDGCQLTEDDAVGA
jgi:hypothetical protein